MYAAFPAAPDTPVDAYILPYPASALQPHLSPETVAAALADLHACQQQLERRLAGSDLEGQELELAVASCQGRSFELAADCFNRAFFWNGLCSRGGGEPGGRIGERINTDFGSLAALQDAIAQQAAALPGDGWVWLVEQADGHLAVTAHPVAGTPLTGRARPLLAIDVSARTWAADHGDDRQQWLAAFWRLVNWDSVERSLR